VSVKDLRFGMVAESADRRSFDDALARCAQGDTAGYLDTSIHNGQQSRSTMQCRYTDALYSCFFCHSE
jgi:hypothetical protein